MLLELNGPLKIVGYN